MRRSLVVAALLALFPGVAGAQSTGPVAETTPNPEPVSSTTGLPAASPAALTYLAFGDSWPYGGHCGGCRPFPGLYAEGLEATTGHPVDFVNLTTNGGGAPSLLSDIKTSTSIRDALPRADIVMIATGGNDLAPAFDASAAGNCGGADDLDCFRVVAESERPVFDAILSEIGQLRSGRPTVVRLVAFSNEFLSDPGLIAGFGTEFGKTGGVVVTRMFRDMQCDVAAAHAAKCVDLGVALNGPDLLRPRDVNTQDGMQAVADAILATGIDGLR